MEKLEDRIKAWQEKADYFVAGCDHVWNTHAVPLRDQYKKAIENATDWHRRSVESNQTINKIESENKALQEKLKVSEHLKELADDAIVTLQKENKALEEKFNKLIYDFYEKEEAAQFPDETMTYKQYQQFTRAAFTVIKSENKALREEIEILKAEAVRNALK